jgi:hypothetical protein
VREERTVALPSSSYVQSNEFQGEIDPEETLRPTLGIVPKVGRLADLFTPGDLLLDNEFVIGGSKSPIELIPVAAKKRYQNDIAKNEDDEYGDLVDSMTEVIERGGIKGYRPFDDKEATEFWKPVLQAVFLVKRGENLTAEAGMQFPYQVGDSYYAFVRYTARNKSAYGNVAKPGIGLALLDAQKRAMSVKGSVRDMTYRLSTKGVTWQPPRGESRSWIEPSLRAIGKTSDELKQFIRDIEG